jgi:hypothetical protein
MIIVFIPEATRSAPFQIFIFPPLTSQKYNTLSFTSLVPTWLLDHLFPERFVTIQEVVFVTFLVTSATFFLICSFKSALGLFPIAYRSVPL